MALKTDVVKLEVLSPVSEVAINRGNAPRFETLNGKTICEVWTTGHYGADRTFPIIRRILQQRFPDIKIVPYTEFAIGKPDISERWGPLEKVGEILTTKKCNAVLLGNGGWGCAGPQSAVGAEAEKAGIPAVSIVSPQFASFAVTSARARGVSDIPVSILPYDVMTGQKEEAGEAYEKAAEEIIFGLTQWKPKAVKKTREESLTFEGNDYQEAIDHMNQHFLSKMWGDGYPLIPPTKKRVDWILTGTDLLRDRVLTDKFPPRNGLITIEKIAINAAMAGTRPEYMPIFLAVVEALATDAGAKIMHFLTNSVTNQAPVLIINGPIAKELNINSSYGIMGPGWQANATIGRTLSLLLINGAGAYFGPGGNLACQSIPGRYSWCFAENEESNPWRPLHVELGYSEEASTVTVLPGKGTHLIFLQPPVEHLLNMIAHSVHGVSVREFGVPWDQLLVLSPSHAKSLADAGLSKQDIQNFVFEKARISLAEGEATGFIFRQSPEWARRVEGITDKESVMIPKTEKPEDLKIIVAGGQNCVSSTLIPGLCNMVTVDVDKYKPAAWNQLLAAAAKAKSRGPLS